MEKLALIILNYNSAADTIKCTNRLRSFGANFHIIIVDNQSTDDSFQVLKRRIEHESAVDLIQTEYNGGYSAGNNFGINYAVKYYGVEHIAIINPDVIIPELQVIERMVNVLERNEKLGIVGALAINAEGEYNPRLSCWNIPSFWGLIKGHSLIGRQKCVFKNLKIIEDKVAQVECVVGCFFIGKVNILNEIGLLDENVFLYNEENILGIKLKCAGYQEAVVLDQFYIHNHHKADEKMSFKKKIRLTKNSYESRKYLCKTYYSRVLLPALWLVEMSNRICLMTAYIKTYIKICFIFNRKPNR